VFRKRGSNLKPDHMRTLFVILTLILLLGCQRQSDGWRPDSHTFTTTQPKQQDLAGSYLLTQQTITTNGLAVLQGRQCQLELRPDGSFSITNYPIWTDAAKLQITNFVFTIFTKGHWTCNEIGSIHGQPLWGILFDPRFDSSTQFPSTALTGKQAPYGLVMVYGDWDEHAEMVFEKKK
jgi:hypothetical protein